MADTLLTLTHATERDVDLILVEELRCSAGFRNDFLAAVGDLIAVKIEHWEASVSHSRRRLHSRREIDILLEIDTSSGRSALLIENKLDTAEQPNQSESYREEAIALVTGGKVATAVIILVCPEAYAAKSRDFAQKFDCVVTYERIRQILRDRSVAESGELAERLRYRADLLTQAIDKSRRGYVAVPVETVSRFTRRYVALLEELGLGLPPGPSMNKDAPSESKTMIFSPSALPAWEFLPQTRLVHQLREGNANLCLYTWGDHFSYLAGEMAPALAGSPYRLVPTTNKRANGRSGLMIVADTPIVDNLGDFDLQREQIEVGIGTVARLAAWFRARHDEFQQWSERVRELRSAP